MLGFLVRRMLHALLTLLALTVIVFMILRLAPGDPARLLLPEDASAEQVARMRSELGLDEPLLVQYGLFMGRLIRLDLGRSLWYGRSVQSVLAERIPYTLQLALTSWAFASIIGILLGVWGAMRQGRPTDLAITIVSGLGVAVPNFWLGIMLILMVSVRARLLPAFGAGTWRHLVLPAFVLGVQMMSFTTRITRSSLLEVHQADYIRTAAAKGLSPARVTWRHALRNALIPVVTVMGLQLGATLGTGMVITESVFQWPGVGRLIVNSVFARDYPVIQGAVVLLGIMFVVLNLIVDLLYMAMDPRVHYE